MRATIRIDDDLYEEVKARAAESGRTVAAVLQDAVRLGLSTGAGAQVHRYQVAPIGRGGLRAGVDLSFNAALAALQDDDEP